jgi:hypothetical protein
VKDVEGIDRDLIEVLSRHLPGGGLRKTRKTSVRVSGFVA